MKLRDGQVVPRKVFSRYSANVIAEAIVARINSRNLTPTPEEDEARLVAVNPLFALRKVPFEARTQAELHYYFPREQAAVIASDGVLNLHQLPRLQYWDRRSKWRKGIEFGLARIHLDDPEVASAESPANMVRPKSVVLDVGLGAQFEMRTWLNHIETDPSRGAQRYGDVVAVLKPTVYKRTTITPCDSGAAERWSCELSRQWVRPLTDRFLYANRPYTEYYEGQVWGKIGVADIQEFRVEPGTDAQTLATLRGTGLPIYTYKVVREFDRYRRIRGDRL